jgi:hypothetical protein
VWEYPELPVHLYDFSPDTARALMTRCGFEPRHSRTFPVPFDFYRSTVLSTLGPGRRAKVLRLAFEALRVPLYPLARLTGRGNYQFLTGTPTVGAG